MDSYIKTNKNTHLHNHNQSNITLHTLPPTINNNPKKKDKLVIIMGATGTGKSRLSIDLATHFPFSEIINSDKVQLYKGLDITTNKISVEERNGIPHHLLGEFEPSHHGELTPYDFRTIAWNVVSDINSRKKLPILVGGSISLVLSEYLSKRVEEMIGTGMFEELAEFYHVSGVNRTGLEKAIRVLEFDRYFRKFKPGLYRRCGCGVVEENRKNNDRLRRIAFKEAETAVKENTCRLAKKQVRKIEKLRVAGWDIQKMDATEAFKALMVMMT